MHDGCAGIEVGEIANDLFRIAFGATSPPLLTTIIAKRDEFDRGMRAIIRQGMDEGLFAAGDPKMMEFAIMGAVNWISKWFDPAGPMTSQQIGEAFADYLVGQAGKSIS